MPPVGLLGLLPVSIFSLLGSIDKTRYMQHYTGRNITISSSTRQYLQVDGDAVPLTGNGEVRIRIQPKAINVVVNE